VNQDFVFGQVGTGLGSRWDEVEEQGGDFPAEVEAKSGRAASGELDGAWALAAVVQGCLGKRKLPLC